jgi:hypothetical protein
MSLEDLQTHSIQALHNLAAHHPDAAEEGHPHAKDGPAPGSHDPSGAPAIKQNLDYDKTRKGEMPH